MNFISTLLLKAKSSFLRFPVVLSWVTVGSLFLIILFGKDDYQIIQNYESVIYTLILGVSWLISVQFLSESLRHNLANKIVYKALCVLGLALFYYYLEHVEKEITEVVLGRWALLLLAGHVCITFSPFITSWNLGLFWNFLKHTAFAILRSLLYSTVLFAGLSLAIVALKFLFDIEFNSYIYLQNFIFCLGIVNTFIYLSDFPKIEELEESVNFNKTIEVLVVYILIPLSLVYILIVYAYAAKILIQWELPRGWITYLISALSLLAFIIHITIEPIRKTHKAKLVSAFFPYYFYAILPLLPLLFIGLWKRISDYNFTELRYLGFLLAIWITVLLVYMLVAKSKNLSMYSKLLFIFILMSSFGPLSAFKISIRAQLNELEDIMKGLNQETELVFSNEDYQRFKSIIRYLGYRDALGKTEPIFGFNPNDAFSKTYTYGIPKKIVDTLNINIDSPEDKVGNYNVYRSYNLRVFKPNYAEEITDYTYFTELKLENKLDENKALQMSYSANNVISFNYYGEPLFESDMTSHLVAMAKKYDYLSDASQDEFTFRFKNENGDFLLIFSNLRYHYKDGNIEIKSGKTKLFYRTFQVLELP